MAEIKDTFYVHSRLTQQLCEPSTARPILLRRQRRLWGAAGGSACLRPQSWRRQSWEEHPRLLLGPLLPPPAPFMLRKAEQGALVGLRMGISQVTYHEADKGPCLLSPYSMPGTVLSTLLCCLIYSTNKPVS